ncbi:hypothetical protein Q4544_15600 [Cognatishimia sp. 1_MG-2023]|uniref:hypothetical protein n=1 Tax=Cognatishimia sp. 1_MG-2023 TaxID=3062642 RepID=UPI0026E41CBC|nr:hypothetical protein [Cognatishimia sp. 1_MG-2023]MDO6728364.1 hypothetical protein [Cognatishimia sp. 1_MG-2023]
MSFARPDTLHQGPISRADARQYLKIFKADREEWRSALSEFQEINAGSKFDGGFSIINNFLVDNVYADPKLFDVSADWIPLVWALSLELGEAIIAEDVRGKLKWSVKNVAFKKFGEPDRFAFEISGFPDPSFTICPDYDLMQFLRQLVTGDRDRPDNIFDVILDEAKRFNY